MSLVRAPLWPAQIRITLRPSRSWRATFSIRNCPSLFAELLTPDARCFIVEDSAHIYETTRAALDGFSQLVVTGGFFVVEDGCVDVDEMRASPDWPRGVLPALHDWLKTPAAADFEVRRDLEIDGISCHPEGFFQRR
jgi:cephalosporin hydroxylase